MKLFDSLTASKREFIPINKDLVTVYTCGPTVYHDTSIGNFRTYVTADILHRTLLAAGYKVKYIMNITDVGHLTGDNLGDSSQGEDRLLVASKRENKTAQDIANFYYQNFVNDYSELNLIKPEKWTKATEHIQEQINLIQDLEAKGYVYRTSDGIYFDTKKFPNYGELSNLDQLKEGARVAINEEKKDPHDFALWKFSQGVDKRQQEWSSPWGVGFPGWHIECSAMSMKYLGESIDIHLGGEDLKSTHHPNEIAQSEASTGRKFVNYWVHVSFLLVNGGKMGKSLGNAYCLRDIKEAGHTVQELKYFYLNAHYRSNLNFTWEALTNSSNSIKKIKKFIVLNNLDIKKEKVDFKNSIPQTILEPLFDDLNATKSLGEFWKIFDGSSTLEEKITALKVFSDVFGFDFSEGARLEKIDTEIKSKIFEREKARKEKNWAKADEIRKDIENAGYFMEDKEGFIVIEKSGSYFLLNRSE